jgi:hypothetical protein
LAYRSCSRPPTLRRCVARSPLHHYDCGQLSCALKLC